MARNQELLGLLNLHFLHFLFHSIKDLYLTPRDSCWKGAQVVSHFVFFTPYKVASCNKGSALARRGFHWKKGKGFPSSQARKTIVRIISAAEQPAICSHGSNISPWVKGLCKCIHTPWWNLIYCDIMC